MEIPEFNRHRIRTQLLKIIAHLRDARMDINQCEEHLHIVEPASNIEGVATLQLDTLGFCKLIDVIASMTDSAIGEASNIANKLKESMEHPLDLHPPISGKHLLLPGMTAMQRHLIRSGAMEHSDVPTHATVIDPNHHNRPRKPINPKRTPPLPPKYKPKKKRNEMPI